MLKYKDLFKYGYIGVDSSSDDFFILCGLEVVLRDRDLPTNEDSVQENLEKAFQEVTGLDINCKGFHSVEGCTKKINPEIFKNKYIPEILSNLLLEEPDYSCIDSIESIGIAIMGMEIDEKIFTEREELKQLLDCKIFQWKERYELAEPVCDGMPWALNINYKNGEVKKYSGSNAFPITWNKVWKIYENHLGGNKYLWNADTRTYKVSKFYGYEYKDRFWEYPFIDKDVVEVLKEDEIQKILKIRGSSKADDASIASRLAENGFTEAETALHSQSGMSFYESNTVRKGYIEILIMRLKGSNLYAFKSISCPNCEGKFIAAIGKKNPVSKEMDYEKEGENPLYYNSKVAGWTYVQKNLRYHCLCCGVTF